MKGIWAAVIALALFTCVSAWFASQFPAKPVGVVTPYPQGGGTDAVARPVAGSFSRAWGQSIVVDNRGGGGVIAAQMVAKTPPDGYTLFLSSGGVIKTQNLKF
jgi:tripartite-type tricarboxylate transporter receptor subunit TctC